MVKRSQRMHIFERKCKTCRVVIRLTLVSPDGGGGGVRLPQVGTIVTVSLTSSQSLQRSA